ncbi:hypothetical protein SAMN05428970_1097 [Agromyces sp. CF514]|uniref:hypothetical protein n=1 Tax=Agromyces sp. CF514 TaxID=1881031 RepID=UPI0008E3181C|nr:hypothetical protein [Agromyces sp. CF514]SFR71020.1 hypothetical protein SAMN05428970_1097 [Agromyces sp. CF514]
MPETLERPPADALSTLPGAPIIRRIRRLLVVAGATGLIYGVLGTASKGGCPGGVTGDGGFLDANGDPTGVVPMCATLTLRPAPIVFLVIVAIVLIAISRVLRRAGSETAALRTLDLAAVAIVGLTAAWWALTLVSFLSVDVLAWDGVGPFPYPDFMLGDIDIDLSPMQTGTNR